MIPCEIEDIEVPHVVTYPKLSQPNHYTPLRYGSDLISSLAFYRQIYILLPDTMADLSTCPPLTRPSVVAARELIRPFVHHTPVLTNSTLTRLASTARDPKDLVGTEWEGRTPARPTIRLWFKCENLQRIGAFKARGAFHAIERLKLEPGWEEGGGRAKGVATHSSGEL